MSIAFNSGLQVALAGTAIAVAAGALLGHEVLIVFPPIELALLAAATIMTAILTQHRQGQLARGAAAAGDLRDRRARLLVPLSASAASVSSS